MRSKMSRLNVQIYDLIWPQVTSYDPRITSDDPNSTLLDVETLTSTKYHHHTSYGTLYDIAFTRLFSRNINELTTKNHNFGGDFPKKLKTKKNKKTYKKKTQIKQQQYARVTNRFFSPLWHPFLSKCLLWNIIFLSFYNVQLASPDPACPAKFSPLAQDEFTSTTMELGNEHAHDDTSNMIVNNQSVTTIQNERSDDQINLGQQNIHLLRESGKNVFLIAKLW